MTERTIVLVAYDGFQLLDLAGPVEIARTATLIGADPPYRTIVATPHGQKVRSESGIEIGADVSLRDLASSGTSVDTLTIIGGVGAETMLGDAQFLDDIAAVVGHARRITSVCSGALLLAATGLLDGYEATTHWAACPRLEDRHPEVTVHPDRIYVQDRDRWTSAGVTAGIDLFLALVEHDLGPELAHQVAGWLVVFVRRPGGQSQFSAQMRMQPAATPSIADVQRWLADHLDGDLGVDALAARAGMSARTFARAFRRETGTTPAVFVETARVEAARRLLETTDLTVAAIATHVGLRHAETLHRAFQRQLATTPDRYRQHFGHQPVGSTH